MKGAVTMVKDLQESNKFLLKSGYVDTTSERGTIMMLVDGMDQLAQVHNDKKGSNKLPEMQGEV